MYFTKRTDMAVEFTEKCKTEEVSHREYELYGMTITDTSVTKEGGEVIGKPQGRYFTLRTNDIPDTKREIFALSAVLRKLLPAGKCLVAGLGNPEIAADSLGWKTAERILATSQYIEHGMYADGIGNISVIRTNVSSNSGIESTVQTKAVASAVNASYIIAIDSLACKNHDRLCNTIQVTDSGICPGSGAGNPRKKLDKDSIGIPVIAVGVPTAMEYRSKDKNYYVTKRDIDIDVRRYAHVISSAINRTLSPALTQEDFRLLMNYG